MKTILAKFLLLVISAALFMGCAKEPDHNIRIKNNFSVGMKEIKLSNATYNNIPSGTTSSYKSVNEGSFTVSGSTDQGGAVSGSGYVKGNGKHNWTVLISSSGDISMSEDKK